LRRARRAIVRNVWLSALSCIVALVLLFVYQRAFPPVYSAEAVLQAELDQDIVRSTYYANWNVFRKGDMKSEPALVTSGRVVEAVVKDLNLKFDDVHHTFLIHLTYLWTDSWLGKKYRSFKEWLFPPDPSAYKPTPEEIEFARTVDAFRKSVDVDLLPNTTLARIARTVAQAQGGRAPVARTADAVASVFGQAVMALAIVTCPASSSEISSRLGPITLHGPHQSAQKSTSTGRSACSTSFSKVASLTVVVAMISIS
jgi:uncharacterized protein involved in exopolysaccharide biosynthesis